jgi:hypothetical protein
MQVSISGLVIMKAAKTSLAMRLSRLLLKISCPSQPSPPQLPPLTLAITIPTSIIGTCGRPKWC